MRALLLDNYDSFTFNLYQLIAEITGEQPVVATNDALTWEELSTLDVDAVIISPGPGNPERPRDFGICRRAIEDGNLPTLGVCLGHQGIASVFGGNVVRAPEPVHGRLSAIYHSGSELFDSLPQGFSAVRYHSLMVARPLPEELEEIATTSDGILMALRHRTRPVWGVQFHPESICTEHGRRLLENFKGLVDEHARRRHSRAAQSTAHARRTVDAPASIDHRPHATSGWRVYSRRLPIYPDAEETFRALFCDGPAAFWLDSSQNNPTLARFSFMGNSSGSRAAIVRYFGPSKRLWVRYGGQDIEVRQPLFSFLKSWLAEHACDAPELPFNFTGGFVGYFGYELKDECGALRRHAFGAPDCTLIFADRFIAFDHLERVVDAVRDADKPDAEDWFRHVERALDVVPPWRNRPAPAAHDHIIFRPDQSKAEYLASVGRCLEHIRDGESYEICLTTQLRATTTIEPLAYYSILRRLNPAPYAAFLKLPDVAVSSSSPECFLKIQPDGMVESSPIKGTIRRGVTATEDATLRETLRTDVKTRAENLMIVDLVRNDLGTVCEVGTVSVPRLMGVDSYATVHQLVSTISGHLRPDMTAVDCLQRAFPGGSMTGAPKLRTMELIDDLEPAARGVYSGALGYLGLNGAADLSIVIRTAVFRDGEVSIGTGGAIVALSERPAEFEELLLKSRALIDAFRQAVGGASIRLD
jgi:para-aminobenzoate synthetase